MTSLPMLARTLGVPMSCHPAWLWRRGRGVFQTPPSLASLRQLAGDVGALRLTVASLGVQEGHAARCRRAVSLFLNFVAGSRRRHRGTVGELLAEFGAHILTTRPQVCRATTLRSWIVCASRPWPAAMRSAEVREFLRGAEIASPVLPEAAGVSVLREIDQTKFRRWMVVRRSWLGGIPLALALGLAAGLRMRETARMLQRGLGFRVVGRLAVWTEAAQTKTNARGARRVADRVSTIPSQCLAAVRSLELPWRATEAEVARVLRATVNSLRRAGVTGDARVHRRVMATRVREAAVRAGADEAEAVGWARRVLAHGPSGEAVYRYLPTLLSRPGSRFLRRAQVMEG